MGWDCLRSMENYCEAESFGPLSGRMCVWGWVLCWGPRWRQVHLGEGGKYLMKLLRLQADLVSALVIMGNLRNPKSMIARLWGRAMFSQVLVFLWSDCFRPVCEPLRTHWLVQPSLIPQQIHPSTQQMFMAHVLWTGVTTSHRLWNALGCAF